ncbi:MAG: hypothetical protein RQ750_05475 [Roseovarius sp.]|nr:hypothetical protein [Roseovarius sp.]
MNVDQIITMVMRMVMRRLTRSGVNAGMDAIGKRMGGKGDMAPGPNGQKTVQRTRQAMKIGRKAGRF